MEKIDVKVREIEVDSQSGSEPGILLTFEIKTENGVITPEDLKTVTIPDFPVENAVVISGRGPIWLYGYLQAILQKECVPWVATFDPRFDGGIIVYPEESAGKIVKFN